MLTKIKAHPRGCAFVFYTGLESISMQMSGGHLLAAVETGGNTIVYLFPPYSKHL